MIAIVVVAVLALVLVAALWSRVAASRMERRSVEGYGRALDTLGGVSKRSEAVAPVQAPGADQLAQPHVRPTAPVQPHARMPAQPIAPAPRIRIRPPGLPGAMPVFSDLAGEEAGAPPAPAGGRGGRRNGRNGNGRAVPAPVDEPTIVLPLSVRPMTGAGNGRGAPVPPVGHGPAEVDEDPLTMVQDALPVVRDPLTMVQDALPVVREGSVVEGPPAEDPLTMVLPAVRADPTPAGPPPVVLYGPPLPGEGVVAPMAPPAGEGEAAAGGGGPRPVFVFGADRGAESSGGAVEGEAEPADGPGEERTLRIRRAATGAAAAVAIGALGAGGWQLASDGSRHHPPAATTTSGAGRTGTSTGTGPTGSGPTGTGPTGTRSTSTGTKAGSPTGSGGTRPGGTSSPTGSSSSSAAPSGGPAGGSGGAGAGSPSGSLQPTSSSASVVDYAAPASSYTISFSVSGSSPCWLGAQAQPGGPYLWMQTVPAGGTASYTASGPVVIRLGAPPSVTVTVNGRQVALPSGNVQPYDISFAPQGRAA